ncbi:small integral membrane protein 11 isoform X1 [Physeter macrocephalus]|uniref:Small integral membrane protein 11 isoform X1 n=1 Tax=Physeter macrocephalus TaxID=9755 RepID=A0A455BI73_PHYMC|nr:small integral membrane protein 11 isoform X1 [Physeter catodon]|eukprot:XP_028348432.1 small integral membrane protein 11A isoform X1 [Physeter catodon]
MSSNLSPHRDSGRVTETLFPPLQSVDDGTEAPRGKSLTRVCRLFIRSSSLLTLGNGETCRSGPLSSSSEWRGPH